MKYVKVVLVVLAIAILMIPGAIFLWLAYIALSIASLAALWAGWFMGDNSSWQECFEHIAIELAFPSDPWDQWEEEEKSNANE